MLKRSFLIWLCLFVWINIANADTEQNQATIKFENFYIVLPPPVATGTAAYGTIINVGDKTDTLLDVKSSLKGMLMLHKTEISSGMADMIHIENHALKPKEKLVLKPMSYHLMFMNLDKGALKENQRVTLSFEFENAGVIELKVLVKMPE